MDKGLRNLITLSTGDPASAQTYGTELSELVSVVVDDSRGRRRRRQAIAAYERSLRAMEPERARRLRRNNLGPRRSSRSSRRQKAQLRDEVNRTLNQVFLAHRDMKRLPVEALDFPGSRIRSRVVNRRLGRWLKGYLHRRLERKAELNGVELNVVNAAYTSQTCPRCWYTARRNRSGGRFQCADCGYTSSADAVAATNVLTRGSDTAVARFTSKYQVKQILDGRWQAARTGRAWGSNDRGSAETAPQERAANNCDPRELDSQARV